MRVLSRVLAGVGLTAALFAPAAASAHQRHDRGFWHRGGDVYVNDNTAGSNTIAAFQRGTRRPLVPLPGSPVATGGAGTGTGTGSQGALQSRLRRPLSARRRRGL